MRRTMAGLALCANLLTPGPVFCAPQAYVGQAPQTAWWVQIRFVPTEQSVYGVPIEAIHPFWVAASALTKEAIPKEALFETGKDAMEVNGGITFSQKGDFNGDGVEDLAVVGVYEDTRERGSFFLILTRGKGAAWEKAFLQPFPGEPGFLGLSGDGHALKLHFCMECGNVSPVQWNAKTNSYEIGRSADDMEGE